MIGSGDNLMSYVYIKNLVDATISITFFRKTIGEIYFINDEHPYEFRKIVKAIYRVMDKKPPTFYVPFLLAYCGAFMYELVCKILGIKALIYPSRVKTMVLNYAYSVKKARTDFGYKPRFNLEKGIKETYLWYVKNGYL